MPPNLEAGPSANIEANVIRSGTRLMAPSELLRVRNSCIKMEKRTGFGINRTMPQFCHLLDMYFRKPI